MHTNDTVARPEGATPTLPHVRRRTVALGAAWSVPAVAMTAPAAHAGVSTCTVEGSIQLAPNITMNVRAICDAQSQWLNPGTIYQNYATSSLPPYLEICNCQNADAWYRWRETDSLSEFQIEVDGVHIDQNSPAAGWRNPVFLKGFGSTGGCQRFNLTYRTSKARSKSDKSDVTLYFTLQTGPSASGPWTDVVQISRSGWIRRNDGSGPANVNFDSCSGGGSKSMAASAVLSGSGD
ncbi:hypothetical protein [Nocardioides bigeumensis]|uniref:Secreted protein n=1 Tax=Nocardioides bigeumensis TaxID=433657 RepID=A0ABN2YI92_9ACTN